MGVEAIGRTRILREVRVYGHLAFRNKFMRAEGTVRFAGHGLDAEVVVALKGESRQTPAAFEHPLGESYRGRHTILLGAGPREWNDGEKIIELLLCSHCILSLPAGAGDAGRPHQRYGLGVAALAIPAFLLCGGIALHTLRLVVVDGE